MASSPDPLPIAPPEPKKPAWNRPNGPADIGPAVVAGAASWPTLSDSAKPSPRSSSDPLKPIPDGHVSDPLNSASSPMPHSSGLNTIANINHAPPPSRQRSMKRGGNVGGGNTGTFADGGVAPKSPVAQGAPQISPREHSGRNASGWEHRPRGGGSENQRGHGGNRRGNNGDGGGNRQNGYGNRGDTEGHNYRGFSNRDGQMHQRGPRPIIRPHAQPVPPAMHFAPAPPTARSPYANPPMVYSELAAPMYYIASQSPTETFRPVSFIPYPVSPTPVFVPTISSHQAAILKQIEYYFSSENLCKDTYLRDHMDDNGWVPISVVAGFNKVKQLTDNVNYILETVRFSAAVEVQGESVRVRNDWMKWVLPSNGNQYAVGSAQQAPATGLVNGL